MLEIPQLWAPYFKARQEDLFQNHALTNHPLSFVLFGHPTEVAIEEITIKDQNFEYYVEVKAEEVPSKAELVTALASIEETHSELMRNVPYSRQ